MLSAVVDTNVIVSGLLRGQATRPILEAFRDQKFRLVISPLLLEEFLRVASRPFLQSYVSARERQAIAWYLQTQAYLVIPRSRITACRDPKDNIFLEAAVAGRADAIVTRDQDLLVLHPFRHIAILTPRQFLRRIGHASGSEQ